LRSRTYRSQLLHDEEGIKMEVSDYDFAKLLRPVEPETFFRDTWEKQPLAVARNEPGYYRGLFSLRDVDPVIAFTRPKFPDPAGLSGEAASARDFVQAWLPDDEPAPVQLYPDVAEVHRAYARGKTIIINAMHYRWAPVAALCRRLELCFGCPVHANMYLTPRGAQGFPAHFDTHDVFVLQIEGTKHWRFYRPARELPLADEWAPLAKDQIGPPTLEALVRPGDLLYMPRGHVHEAFTSDDVSLHLTVGIKVFRWLDLLRQALDEAAARDVRFRGALPPGLLSDGRRPAGLDGQFRELIQILSESARADPAIDRLAGNFLGKLAPLPADYFTDDDAGRIGLDTVLERGPGVICRVGRLEDGRAILRFPGGSLDGPPKIAGALHFIARTPRFAVRSLPDDLTSDGKLVLVRRLFRDKVLTRAVTAFANPNP
jgi:hypothetical protein